MEKKSCRCRLFSCFQCCFSDDNSTTLPPAQCPDPSVTSTAATDDALHHRPQPAASTSSEATTSTDVPQPIVHPAASASSKTTTSTDVPQPIVPPAASTSSETTTSPVAFPARDKVYQVASTSSNAAASSHNVAGTSSSSSVSKASHLIDNIVAAASAVDTDADLDDLIGYISTLLEHIKAKNTETKSSKTEHAKDYWQSRSGSLRKIREILSDGINVFKDIFPGEATTAFQGLFKGMGMAHLACTGLLVVALVLERFDTVSTNKEECLCVLDEICKLGKHVNDLKQRSRLRKDMEASIREATDLIMEASIMCSTQIGSSKGRRLLSASGDKEELVKFQQKLQRMYRHMDSKMSICLYDATECRKVRPQKPRERSYPDYAVGIEKPLEEVKKLLDWESEKNAVAVILHGFGGMGKTTLADAVFARVYVEGCKYSMVRLFDDVTSTPSTSDIVKLQKYILEDLKMGTPEETTHEIRTVEEGQREIGRILQKEKAFIYVDNVLQPYPFEQLLPRDMDKAKKLRLLITTRNTTVSRECSKLKTEIYTMKGLPPIEAKSLLEKEMYSDADNMEKITVSQLDHILEMSGYIPKLLTVIARFIRCAEDKQKAYSRLKEERETNWKGEIGDDITHYVFAYQTLDERVKDPFLDICSFLNGQEWSTVADIVGDGELNSLEKRALVTKKRTEGRSLETVWVHDVILAMGHQQTEGTRFSSAKKIQEFLDEKEDKDIQKIKGIVLSKVDDTLSISASKLDLMRSSLRGFQLGKWSKVDGKCTKIFEKLICVVVDIPNFPIDVSRSKELKYLRWEGDLNEELLRSISELQFLRVLKLHSCNNLTHLPKEMGSLNSLQKLHVHMCTSLQALPSSLENLSSLQELRLSNCDRLKALPSSLGKLSLLRSLDLWNCESLKHLPKDIGSLNSLRTLHLYQCKSLEEIPSSIENLSSLQELRLSSCDRLKALPSSLGKLSSLRFLHLSECQSLKDLPCDLGKLTSLTKLSLSGCKELSSIPESIGQLTSLTKLSLSGCKELSSIPESIGQLKSLESSIDLSDTGLKELPDGFCNLSFITNLEMGDCERLEKLPDRFGEVASLRKLNLANCKHLEKLPESFGQLKYLEHLNLSGCTILEELCIDFNGFSSLRFLKLDCCKMLKKLPEDFHCLTSLEVLSVRDCHMLDGKCMENLVEMKTLQTVKIRGSPMLEERWTEIERQGDHSWSFAVYRGQGSSNEESKQHILKQLHSEIDSILTNGRVSDLPLNTLLLVMFDGTDKFDYDFPLSLIEENIDDIPTNFEMIYFGNHFYKLPQKMADRILGHAPANSNGRVLFQKVLAAFGAKRDWRNRYGCRCEMSAKIVNDEKNDKYLSCWELLSEESMEKLVIKKCGRYLKLKQVVEKGGESNRELLRELFASGEEEGTLSFLKNDASQEMRVEELEGKTILLDIRPATMYAEMQSNNLLQSLKEMYFAEKERLDFEIITIPMRKNGGYVFQQFSRQVPWLLLQNPGQLKSVIKFFLVEDCAEWLNKRDRLRAWDRWYPGIMRVIERNGTIAGHNPAVLRMVNTWGAKAYPFTEEKRVELEEEEGKQMKGMSNLEFLFQNMESLWEQVKEIMFKGKMICLYSTSEEAAGFAGSITNALIELGDNIHIIYIPLINSGYPAAVYFTESIWTIEYNLKNSKMPQIEMQGMPVLNLCEQEAMLFWARIYCLKECINGMDDNDKQLDRINKLLYFIDQGFSNWTDRKHSDWAKQYSWMGIMDEDGELVTTVGKETIDNPKELIEALIKCTKDCKRETLVELE